MPEALMMVFRRSILVVLILLPFAGAGGYGQEFVAELVVPDSFSITQAGNAAYDSASGKLYIPGRRAVSIIQAPGTRRIKRVDTKTDAYTYGSFRVLVHQGLGKAYVVPTRDSAIPIIRTADDSLIGYLRPTHLGSFILNAKRGAVISEKLARLYVMSSAHCLVYDLTADTLLHRLRMPKSFSVGKLAYNTIEHKLYSEVGVNELAIFDAGPDTLLNIVQAGDGATGLGYLAHSNKVYYTNFFGASVTIVCGAGDTVITELSLPSSPDKMVMNETDGRVYISIGHGYVIVCGQTDSVRRVVRMSGGRGTAGVWHEPTNRVYLASHDTVYVLDGATDSLLNTHYVPVGVGDNHATSHPGAVYFYPLAPFLTCIDPVADSVLWNEHMGFASMTSLWSRRHRRLMVGFSQGGGTIYSTGLYPPIASRVNRFTHAAGKPIMVTSDETGRTYTFQEYGSEKRLYQLDSTGATIDTIFMPGWMHAAVFAPGGRRLYISGATEADSTHDREWLVIIDTDSNKLVHEFELRSFGYLPGVFNEAADKLYWQEDQGVVIISLSGDSIIGRLELGASNTRLSGMFAHPTNGLVYFANRASTSSGIYVFDTATDSLVRFIPASSDIRRFAYAEPWNKLYGGNRSGAITIINCDENYVQGVISTIRAYNIAYNPMSQRLLVTSGRTGDGMRPGATFLVAFDCETDQPTAWLETGPVGLLAVDPDSGYAYVACHNSAIYVFRDQTPGSIAEPVGEVPQQGLRIETFPSPTAGGTLVELMLPDRRSILLTVHDVTGRRVGQLLDEVIGPGRVQLHWNGTDDKGRPLSSGVYYIRFGETGLTGKVVIKR